MSFSPKALYDWYRNTLRNPKYRWWIILGTLAYLISPIDISPDFFPIVGQIDDIMLVTLLVSELSQIAIDFARVKRGMAQTSPADVQPPQTVDINAMPVDER